MFQLSFDQYYIFSTTYTFFNQSGMNFKHREDGCGILSLAKY